MILKHEMIWTQLWFRHQKKRWEERMNTQDSAGHHAYAAKQVVIWSQFLESARKEFSEILTNVS
jgi:hypothetical protein